MRLFILLLAPVASLLAAPPSGPVTRVPFAQYKAGQTPEEAMRSMSLPKGFQVKLVAGEPRVVQPIAMCFDERGRLWVVEGMSYPKKRPDGQGPDRILILEDTKHDGNYDKVTVFLEGLNLVSGIEVGYGGVWIGAAPELLFIPKDAQDRPGKPQVMLDGWAMQDTHETLNSFLWGPDGWLYGCHGVFTHSKVGRPGTPEEQRVKINAGVWRFHPTRHVFEVFAEGTSNPWGLDFNDRGELFITACVIPHLYHILPGGRYQRQAGQHFNPFTYDDIRTIADHAHYAGGRVHNPGVASIPESTDEVGGGHAHCGLNIYQADNFPPEYRGMLLFGNLHGHRLVSDFLEPKASGYVGRHGNDFLRANDSTFIPVTQRTGPDGALYVSDWSDKQVCHNGNTEIWDRSNGRIYRVSYGEPNSRAGDLNKCTPVELAGMALDDPNEFFVRQARRILAERGVVAGAARELLVAALREKGPAPRRLRALWALQSTGSLDDALLASCLADPEAHLRAWAVRLIAQQWTAGRAALAPLAAQEPSPVVRRELASALSCLPLADRGALARALIARDEDAADPNIPLLLWYGIEPLVGAEASTGLALAETSRLPKVTEFIYRRLAGSDATRDALLRAAAQTTDLKMRHKLLDRLVVAIRQSGGFRPPPDWPALVANLRREAKGPLLVLISELDAQAGDEVSRAFFREIVGGFKYPSALRAHALSILVASRDRGVAPVVHRVLRESVSPGGLRRPYIQALATVGDGDTARELLLLMPKFSAIEQSDAVATLVSNAESGRRLLAAVELGSVDKALLTPVVVRQLKALGDAAIDAALAKVVGVVNRSKADFAKSKEKYAALLKPAALQKADLAAGKSLFLSSCGLCHQLFGEGAQVGPNLTGSNRANLDYLLENVLDPNALIGKDYQLNIFRLKGGSTVSGIVQSEDAQSFTTVMPGGAKFTFPKSDVAGREVMAVSLMPEGLFDALSPAQVINLTAYLQSPDGHSLPAAAGPSGAPAWRLEGVLEGESLKVLSKSAGTVRNQPMTSFKASRWSGNDHLWWTGAQPGDTLVLALPVARKGVYQLIFNFTKAHDYGVFTLSLDGKPLPLGSMDFYHPSAVVTTGEVDAGRHELDAGEHRLEVKILAPNPAATPRHMFGLDYIKLEQK